MRTLGIDISTYQNGINLENIKKDDVNFVIIRGGFTGLANKTMAIDDRFIEHYNNAKNNNLDVGIYYFSRATTYEEGKNEAEFLYNNCLIDRTFEYPVYIDVEDTVYQIKAGKENVTNAIKGFCEYIESKGFYVGIYCNLNWANNYMNYSELSSKYDFWLAYWGKEEPKRSTYGNYGLWQFGGSINEIRSSKIDNMVVDQNYSYKDYKTIMINNNLNNFKSNEIVDSDENTSNTSTSDTTDNNNNTNNNVNNEKIEKNSSLFDSIFKLFKKIIDYIILKFKK